MQSETAISIPADGLDIDDLALERRVELMRGSAGTWREDRAAQLQMLERIGLEPGHRLLEIGCGPLQAGVPLIRYLDTGNYTGVDVSAERLAVARDLVAHFGLEERAPDLIESTNFGRDILPARGFDRIWCFQVAIHFTLPVFERFMAAVSELLAEDGLAWFSARVGDHDGFKAVGSWLEFPVSEASADFYREAASKVGLECVELGWLGELGLPAARPGAKNPLFQLSRP